ncbi:MAG: TlpA family protein disulfide reductase [Betaproteobacteria bacterium]|nr:TlpA family protein disulfide reductase [Betaproteobacteria bacterium]
MRTTLAAISLVSMLVAGAALAGETASPLIPANERKPAPELRLTDLDGKLQNLADLRGKVVLVNFWATWCPPCRREMPSMQRLYQSQPKERFEILAVNIGEDDGTVFAFTGTLEPSPAFPLLLDRDSGALHKWPVKGLPTSFIVDKQGRVAWRAVGGRDFDSPAMAAQLRALLDERQ